MSDTQILALVQGSQIWLIVPIIPWASLIKAIKWFDALRDLLCGSPSVQQQGTEPPCTDRLERFCFAEPSLPPVPSQATETVLQILVLLSLTSFLLSMLKIVITTSMIYISESAERFPHPQGYQRRGGSLKFEPSILQRECHFKWLSPLSTSA